MNVNVEFEIDRLDLDWSALLPKCSEREREFDVIQGPKRCGWQNSVVHIHTFSVEDPRIFDLVHDGVIWLQLI